MRLVRVLVSRCGEHTHDAHFAYNGALSDAPDWNAL